MTFSRKSQIKAHLPKISTENPWTTSDNFKRSFWFVKRTFKAIRPFWKKRAKKSTFFFAEEFLQANFQTYRNKIVDLKPQTPSGHLRVLSPQEKLLFRHQPIRGTTWGWNEIFSVFSIFSLEAPNPANTDKTPTQMGEYWAEKPSEGIGIMGRSSRGQIFFLLIFGKNRGKIEKNFFLDGDKRKWRISKNKLLKCRERIKRTMRIYGRKWWPCKTYIYMIIYYIGIYNCMYI